MSDDEKAEPEEAKPEEGEPEEAEPEATKREATAKKRKKKRRKRAVDEGSDQGPARPPGWPSFASTFPQDDQLDALVLAFERGDYASVRSGAKGLLDERPARPDDVRRGARELLRRVDPDPIAIYLLAGAALLLAFLSIWYWTHRGGAL